MTADATEAGATSPGAATSGDRGRRRSAPGWGRPKSLRRQLAVALVVTALLAVLTFGALNFGAARDLLVTGTQNHLAAVGATRAQSIEAGAERMIDEISVTASDAALAQAMEELVVEFAALQDERLGPRRRAQLEEYYDERLVQPLNAAGLGPYQVEDLLPGTPAGRWLQSYYTVRAPGEPPPVDPGDGSGYTEVNARITDAVRAFSEARSGGDILLIDDTGTVVYSLEKRNDYATNLLTGPYSQSALADVLRNRLPGAPVGTTLLTDFGVSPTGRSALYAVSALSDGSSVVGALAVQIPVAALNQIVNAGGDWDGIGLAEGDSYIVASDLRLQSEPRAWIEDPEAYLDELRSGDESDQAEADLIELFGSPVGIQVIDTAPVRSALDGEDFRGAASNYFGDSTFAAAEPFNASDRQWVVVTEVPRSVAVAPLQEYLLKILIVLAIVLPIVAGLGAWLSRLLARPIQPTVAAAEAVALGDRSPDVDTSRHDEYGDLGRRLSAMAEALATHEAELTDEYERTRRLLLAVLPPDLVDEDGKIIGTGEAAEQATVVAVTVGPSFDSEDPALVGEALHEAAGLAEQVAADTGLDRVRIAADRYLFLAGIGSTDTGAETAVDFVDRFRARLPDDVTDVELDLHVGLSTGPVATGVLDTGSLTFGAWGEPVRRALALASLSKVDSVLIDASTALACTRSEGRLERAHDLVDLDDEPMDLYTIDAPAQLTPAATD